MAGPIQEPQLLMRLLDATALRQRVIADNLSNQNTPGFTRKEVVFEELLNQAQARGQSTRSVHPLVVEDASTTPKPDGNNVLPEQEVAAQRSNKLMYDVYLAILNSHFGMLQSSIQSGQ